MLWTGKGPSLHFWPGPQSASSASCLGEWQEALSLPHPRAEHPLVAQDSLGGLFICAKYLFVAANGWLGFTEQGLIARQQTLARFREVLGRTLSNPLGTSAGNSMARRRCGVFIGDTRL